MRNNQDSSISVDMIYLVTICFLQAVQMGCFINMLDVAHQKMAADLVLKNLNLIFKIYYLVTIRLVLHALFCEQ